MKTEISEYQKQAIDFLNSTNTEFKAEFLRNGLYFPEDKESRDIYQITLKRGGRVYSFEFGQSINCSGEYQVAKHLQNKLWCEQTTGGKTQLSEAEFKKLRFTTDFEKDIVKNPNYSAPTEYDVLACLTKYDPGTFENFCSEFGYNTDSRKAKKTFKAVRKEYQSLKGLFSDSELELMQEIN